MQAATPDRAESGFAVGGTSLGAPSFGRRASQDSLGASHGGGQAARGGAPFGAHGAAHHGGHGAGAGAAPGRAPSPGMHSGGLADMDPGDAMTMIRNRNRGGSSIFA